VCILFGILKPTFRERLSPVMQWLRIDMTLTGLIRLSCRKNNKGALRGDVVKKRVFELSWHVFGYFNGVDQIKGPQQGTPVAFIAVELQGRGSLQRGNKSSQPGIFQAYGLPTCSVKPVNVASRA